MIRGLEGTKEESSENAAQLEGFFADRPWLREVRLAGLHTRDASTADVFCVIAERCPQLKKIALPDFCMDIDYRDVVALESMKELRIPDAELDEMKVVTICERSPLVEILVFTLFFSSDSLDLQPTALDELGALTEFVKLQIFSGAGAFAAPSLVTRFIGELARNSGASFRRLVLGDLVPLPTSAIEALASGCGKLRYLEFYVHVGEATPASIRYLIDCIVADPDWVSPTIATGEPGFELQLWIDCNDDGMGAVAHHAGRAAFHALAAPVAYLPAGVRLIVDGAL